MSIPEMSGALALQYLAGRTEATMLVLSIVIANRDLPAKRIIAMYQVLSDQVTAVADSSPEAQAHAQGYASLKQDLEKALSAEVDASRMTTPSTGRNH